MKIKLLQAAILGTKAFIDGKKCVPCHDVELMKLISDLKVGEGAVKIFEIWIESWMTQNLKTDETNSLKN